MTFDLGVNKANSICAHVINRKLTVGDSCMCVSVCMCGIVPFACVICAVETLECAIILLDAFER